MPGAPLSRYKVGDVVEVRPNHDGQWRLAKVTKITRWSVDKAVCVFVDCDWSYVDMYADCIRYPGEWVEGEVVEMGVVGGEYVPVRILGRSPLTDYWCVDRDGQESNVHKALIRTIYVKEEKMATKKTLERYKPGDAVECLYDGQWYPGCKITEVCAYEGDQRVVTAEHAGFGKKRFDCPEFVRFPGEADPTERYKVGDAVEFHELTSDSGSRRWRPGKVVGKRDIALYSGSMPQLTVEVGTKSYVVDRGNASYLRKPGEWQKNEAVEVYSNNSWLPGVVIDGPNVTSLYLVKTSWTTAWARRLDIRLPRDPADAEKLAKRVAELEKQIESLQEDLAGARRDRNDFKVISDRLGKDLEAACAKLDAVSKALR